MYWSIKLLVFYFILKFIKRVLSNFFLSLLISYSTFICTILCLKYSLSTRNINIITILWVSSYYKFLDALRAFHSELINFSRMEITHPCFNSIESDSFSNHILTALASYMERGFVSDFSSTDSLTLNHFKWFFFSKLTFFWWNFFRVVIFWDVEVIGPSCCKSTHFSIN